MQILLDLVLFPVVFVQNLVTNKLFNSFLAGEGREACASPPVAGAAPTGGNTPGSGSATPTRYFFTNSTRSGHKMQNLHVVSLDFFTNSNRSGHKMLNLPHQPCNLPRFIQKFYLIWSQNAESGHFFKDRRRGIHANEREHIIIHRSRN